MPGSYSATARAHANIALIKYWGKADESLVIPTTSSLSLTLDGLTTQTTVEFLADGDSATGSAVLQDTLSIDGRLQGGTSLQRVSRFLDLVRDRAGIALPARVASRNTVPFGAGLASSASAFAALAAAASRAAGLELPDRELSRLARRGSGSACRSIYGGLVKWNAGHDDGSSYAEPVENPLDLAIIVVLISAREKPMSSREAMRLTMCTSPLYPAWVQASDDDMRGALAAVSQGDLRALGEVAEANALGMHAAMMAARPGVIYWLPQTVAALAAVRDMRTHGFDAWSTMDAGANVKVLTSAPDAERVADELRNRLPDCTVEVHRPGSGVQMVG
ncbi:diphosphomevalonate decarboxylase [Bifidobacterium sp.]|jgi:diphosphomevalonate decarboxylase|uniref:diphosphomevalonate decarboxylase n=1 Tax=Bifidobacterium sp. TaxID=41200 RepID=UPI0025C0BC38|nr:diphosphomevalonate decarboxylase [Bifidobacterium sp.]MCH4209367.1 diphosphomevalonate decarboxylase [Bifidobacterium sp.]MCI1225157.1 diphosphomevalonate decarboxylase [Bifidobacterium sp.]